MPCLKFSVTKSCVHNMSDSFNAQVMRLLEAGHPSPAIATVSGRLNKSIPSGSDAESNNSKRKVVSIPYIHSVSHRLKKVVNKYGVKVVFTPANKLGQICATLQRKNERLKDKIATETCSVKHTSKYTDCRVGVVYKHPLSCDSFYVGQTGRCVSRKLLEHKRLLNGGSASNISLHCRDFRDCDCKPKKDECAIFQRHNNEETRLIIQDWRINNSGSAYMSRRSINQHKEEIKFVTFISRVD